MDDTTWRKSSRCDTSSCAEAAVQGDAVALRNSDDPEGPVIKVPLDRWGLFIKEVEAGIFDLFDDLVG